MPFTDDDLTHLETHGVPPLPADGETGTVENENARIWYARYGSGPQALADDIKLLLK